MLPAQQADDPALNRARSVTRALATEVRQLLSAALAAEGYAGAIQACSQTAQVKTQAVAASHGVPVRRVSLRHRNPLSQPDKWESKQLARASKSKPEKHRRTR